jgi:AmmeMemoRadiSam system protein A
MFTDTSPPDTLPAEQARILLPIARAAIASALGHPGVQPNEDAPWLQSMGACFVTLKRQGRLRGCVGSLNPHRSLLADLKANAVSAALDDTRFQPLTLRELADCSIEVSVLSPLDKLHFDSEAQALSLLRPNIDGVVLSCHGHVGTFLPQVWEQLPEPRDFLHQLKRKAGLPEDFWADTLQLSRYTVSHCEEPLP